MNYTRFLNAVSLARRPSPIRALTDLLTRSPPSMISLAGGVPNPQLFPFASAQFKLRNGGTINIDEKKMKIALQYGASKGLAELLDWLRKLQLHVHNPPTAGISPSQGGMDLLITIGAQDGLCKTFEMCVNPGDNVLIDCPAYAGTLAILRPLGCNLLPVETDEDGMIPDSLRKHLSPWKPEDRCDENSNIPRILYTTPNGVNPTGASLSLSRRKEIYQIAQQYDLLIMEDDPYYYLQFGKPLPSLLSMDVDGRVLRYDSFSKILSSGMRLGFVSGAQPLVDKLQLHMQVSVLHASTLSQVVANEILQLWGIDGFMSHVKNVVEYYSNQKDHMIRSAEKHLSGLAEWKQPSAGMFLWMKLLGIQDTKQLIESKALEKQVALVPGCAFMPDPDQPCPYVRASFSLATPDQMDEGLFRLACLIREEAKSTQLQPAAVTGHGLTI